MINEEDLGLARKYIIGDDEVKKLHLNILVDRGFYNLCINETIQSQLDLPFLEKRKGQLADGSNKEYDLVGPFVLKFKIDKPFVMR